LLKLPCIEQPAQEIYIGADEPVAVMMDRPEVKGTAQLNAGSFARHVVVTANEGAEPVRNWHEHTCGNHGWGDDEHAITAVLVGTVSPWYVGPIESSL